MNPVIRWWRRVVPRGAEGSVVEAGPEVLVGREDRMDGKHEAYGAEDRTDVTQDNETQGTGGEEPVVEGGEVNRVQSDGLERLEKVARGDDDRWDVFHGGRSFNATAIAAVVLIGIDILDGVGMYPVWTVLASYCFGVLVLFWGDRRLFRRRQALLPPDRHGSGRLTLALAALIFWLCGDATAERLSGWLAVTAIVLGGIADGAWIAIVSARRKVGFWRAWRELIVRDGEARRYVWSILFGEDRSMKGMRAGVQPAREVPE